MTIIPEPTKTCDKKIYMTMKYLRFEES